ncbi:hypothetical protein Spob040 [Spilosoma obliqua nucleopolyhedrosis virus]|nr:hypothetical protein Spob040 [Spilosoma obliqua nucleopolyhedrosis virus]
MDSYTMQHFYNNERRPLAATTLHDGNISESAYEDVTFIRKLMCKENVTNEHEYQFCNDNDYNKENSTEKTQQ